MQVRRLSADESWLYDGATHLVEITADDLTETTLNTAQTIQLFNVKIGDKVQFKGGALADAFENASDNALNSTTIILGDDGSTNRFLASTQINENGSEVLFPLNTTDPYAYLAANTVDAVFGSMTGKSLSNVDTGVIHLLFQVSPMARWKQLVSIAES